MAKSMVEAEQSLGSTRKKKPSAAETAVKIVKTIGEAAGILPKKEASIRRHGVEVRKPPTISVEERVMNRNSQIEQEKLRWAKAVESLRKGAVTEKLVATLPLERAQARIESALSNNPTLKTWLVPEGKTLTSPVVAQIVTEIAESPLRDDPHYLLVKGAQLNASLKYEDQLEGQSVLRGIKRRVLEMRGLPTHLSEEARHSMTADKQREFLFTQRVLGEIGTPTAAGAGTGVGGAPDIFSGVDLSSLSPADRQWIQDRIDYARAHPGDINSSLLDNWIKGLQNRVRRMGDPEREAQASRVIDRLYGRLSEFSEERRIPTTIMLTHEEVARILDNPFWFFENYAQEIEQLIQQHGFDSPVVEQRLNRYRLIADYFSSDFYDERVGLGFDSQVALQDRESFIAKRNELITTKAEILRQYSDRLHIMEFSYILSNVQDFDKDTRLIGILDRLGDGGAFGSRTHWGALSEVMVNKVRRIHGDMLRNPETAKQFRSLPDVMREVERRAALEMYDERAIWGPQYKFYLEQLRAKAGDYIKLPPDEQLELDKITCQAMARIASGSYQLFFEKEEVMTRGSHPALGALIEGINQFVTANAEEKILATFRIRDWFYRKWTNMLDGQKAVWNLRSLYYVHKDPELSKWAREKTNDLWTKLQVWKSSGADKNDALLIDLKTIFSEYEDKDEMSDAVKFFSRLKRDTLYHYVAVDIGGEWAQMHAAKPYGFWGSGVRRNTIFRALRESARYGPLASENVAQNKLFLGREILDAANAHFHPSVHRREISRLQRREHSKKNKFIDVLNKALKYHPHTFVKMRADELRLPMGTTWAATYKEASRLFDVLQSQLMLHAEAPIDYSQGYNALSDSQKRLVDGVFDQKINGLALSKDEYFKVMTGYHTELNGHMDQFAHVRYAPALSFLLWTDDIPIAGLEMPTLVRMSETLSEVEQQQLLAAAANNPALSRQIVERGRGRNGLWRRAWGDFIVASTLVPAEIDTLTNNEKQFTEAIVKLAKTIPTYQTHVDGAIAVLEAEAGFLGAAKVKGGYTEFLKWMKNSSILKEFWGDESLSLGLDELAHTHDKFQALVAKLSRESPAYAEAFESYVGLTNWRRLLLGDEGPLARLIGEENFDHVVEVLNENVPWKLYLYKGKNAFLFGLIILGLFAADQARKGGEQAKD